MKNQTGIGEPVRDWFPISFMGAFTDWADVTHGAEKEFGQLTCGCHPNCGVGMAVMIDKETKEAVPVTAFLKAEQLAKDVQQVSDAARGRGLSILGMALALIRNYDPFKAPSSSSSSTCCVSSTRRSARPGRLRRASTGRSRAIVRRDDIAKRRADRWNFLFIAGMWFQDLFNYDFRRTEMCIIPYATQQGEISFCAYNTGVGWRNIIEKMHMTATLTKWYEEHGRHEIFAGNKNVPLPTLEHKLALNPEAVAAGAQTDLDELGIAKNAREEKLNKRDHKDDPNTTKRWRACIASRCSRSSRRFRFRVLAGRRRSRTCSPCCTRRRTSSRQTPVSSQAGEQSPAFFFYWVSWWRLAWPAQRVLEADRAVFDHDIADDRDRPAWRRIRRGAVQTLDGQLLAEDADLFLFLGDRDRNRLGAGRRHRLHAARACSTRDAVHQIVTFRNSFSTTARLMSVLSIVRTPMVAV